MRSLGYISDPTAFESTRALLRSHGIPTYVESTGKNMLDRRVVFICINDQYDDAIAVLKNPHHVVAQPVDVDTFELATRTTGMGTILKGSLTILAVLLAIVGACIAIGLLRGQV